MMSRIRRWTPQAVRCELADRTHDLDIEMEVLMGIRPKCDRTFADERRPTASTTPPCQPSGDRIGTTFVSLHVDISALQVHTMKTVSDTSRGCPEAC